MIKTNILVVPTTTDEVVVTEDPQTEPGKIEMSMLFNTSIDIGAYPINFLYRIFFSKISIEAGTFSINEFLQGLLI